MLKVHAKSLWSHFRFEVKLFDGGSFPGLTEARLEISYHIAYHNATLRSAILLQTTSKPIFKQRHSYVRFS